MRWRFYATFLLFLFYHLLYVLAFRYVGTLFHYGGVNNMCVCVCVCEEERERESECALMSAREKECVCVLVL